MTFKLNKNLNMFKVSPTYFAYYKKKLRLFLPIILFLNLLLVFDFISISKRITLSFNSINIS
jgi:hypothetical protein